MKSKARLQWIVLVAAVVVAALAAGAARADSVRVTRGDAEAVLNAFPNGGFAVLRHSPVDMGAPADGLVSGLAVIRPFAFFNGKHYCVLDWHVAALAIFEGGDRSFTRQDAEALLGPISSRFWIDGVPVEPTRTPIKRSLRDLSSFGITEAYYIQEGVVLSPADLAVGAHTLRVETSDGFDNEITFYMDDAGTGTCV